MISIVVVCEASADFQLASTLADRVLCERVEWIEADLLPHLRAYRGLSESEAFLRWDRADDEARARNIRVHGGFPDGPAELEAKMVRRAIRLVRFVVGDDTLMVLIRDDDDQRPRRLGFEQARSHAKRPELIVVGIAHTKRECWVLAGFDPTNESEQERLEAERQTLGFDPRDHADRLTAKHDEDKLSAKRVLAMLTNSDRNRETACWNEASLNILRQRGEKTGLDDYLSEVAERLVPHFVAEPASTNSPIGSER